MDQTYWEQSMETFFTFLLHFGATYVTDAAVEVAIWANVSTLLRLHWVIWWACVVENLKLADTFCKNIYVWAGISCVSVDDV